MKKKLLMSLSLIICIILLLFLISDDLIIFNKGHLSHASFDEKIDSNKKSFKIKEEVIVKNDWETNKLNLTRKTVGSIYDEGTEVLMPTDLMVVKDRVFVFDAVGEKVVEINKEGKLQSSYPINKCYLGVGINKERYLYYRTDRGLFELDLLTKNLKEVIKLKSITLISYDMKKGFFYTVDSLFKDINIINNDKSIKTINVKKLLFKNNIELSGGLRRITKNSFMYSPSEYKSVESLAFKDSFYDIEEYSQAIYMLNMDDQKIKRIKSNGREFGYYILGIDKTGRIFTTTNECVNRILIHDKTGNFLAEIIPDFTKYGNTEISHDELLRHPVFVTDEGEIYILMRMKEGIFIVKYTI